MTENKQITKLIIDAATPVIQVGISNSGTWLSFQRIQEPATSGIFLGIKKALQEAKLGVSQIDTVVYSQGPGSTLGIRLVASLIAAWKSAPAQLNLDYLPYNPLGLAYLKLAQTEKEPFAVLAPAPNRQWYVLPSTSGIIEIKESNTLELKTFYLPMRKMPDGANSAPYDIESSLSLLNGEDILRFSSTENEVKPHFQNWTPERHK